MKGPGKGGFVPFGKGAKPGKGVKPGTAPAKGNPFALKKPKK